MRALVIDDDVEKRETLKKYLAMVDIDAITCPDLPTGMSAIASGGFDSVFIDDRMMEDGRKVRLANVTIHAVRGALPDVYIVAYSAQPANKAGYFDTLMSYGANAAKAFQDILKEMPDWPARIREHGEDRLRSVSVKRPDDVATRAALETLGESVFQRVVLELIGSGEAVIQSLSGSMSGDTVLHLRLSSPNVERDYVLKFSRSEAGLLRELRGLPRHDFHGVGLEKTTPTPVDGWWAGVAEFVPKARTLEQLLLRLGSANGAHGYARILWNDLLASQVLQAAKPTPAVPSAVSLSSAFVHSVNCSSEHVAEALRVLHGKRRLASEITQLAARTSDREGAVWPFRMDEELWSYCHGDFHARNLLWIRGVPFLIDWARASEAPRCTDICCLVVDIVVRAPQLRLARQWSMTQSIRDVASFSRFLVAIFAGKSAETADPTGTFVRDLLARLIAARVSPSEIARALCFQFLRYFRFESLPTTRRAVAGLCAARLVDDYKL
jgi:hypothetical protein